MKLKRLALAGFSLLSMASFAQDFNYGEALQKSLFFYEAQQSGPLPEWNRVGWRSDSAINDGSDVNLDLTGGWYDAGDNVKFNFPMAYSVTILAWAAIEYPEAYESSGQLEILKRNLKFVTDYFIKCHTAPTEFYGQVGNGTLDHAWWGSPELVELVMERPSYKIDAENPGSDLAAETAAAMAATSMLFAESDPDYSAELLEHAVELYEFADNYRGKYSDAITDAATFYRSWSGYQDELVWGAIWLYRASGNETYLNKAIAEYDSLGTEIGSDDKSYKWGLAWDDKGYGCYVLMSIITGENEYKADVERHLDYWTVGYEGDQIEYSPGGQAHLTLWGSLRHSANTSLLALIYSDKVIPNTEKAVVYHDFAVNQIDYALGENPLNRSFMVGYGNNPAHSVHHRAAHGSWANSWQEPIETSHVIYGALAGGPESPDDFFEDDRNNYFANEVACDYNAGLTGALARLYSEYGGDPLVNFPPTEEPTREEIRTVSTFQSTNNFGSTIRSFVQNRTSWPPRVTDQLTYKYFIDITEAVEAGFSIDDYTISVNGFTPGSMTSIKEIEVWDAEANIYAIVVSLEGDGLAPINGTDYRRDCQLVLSVSNGVPYDSSNDWSAEGLADSDLETPKIPVYDNGVLVFGEEPGGANSPRAVIETSATSGVAPLAIEFDGSKSTDPNGDNLTYAWDFGDGSTGTGVNPNHTYTTKGDFEVSLIVSDGENTSEDTVIIKVTDGTPIVSYTTSTTSTELPFLVNFDASGSTDPEGAALSYAWIFGNGDTANTAVASTTYTVADDYAVSLTVTNVTGKSSTESFLVTVSEGGATSCNFDTPRATSLPSSNTVYENIFVLGDGGPDLSSVNKLTINWDTNSLHQFDINLNASPWHVNLKDKATYSFGDNQPEITLESTGISGLDGSYYVTLDGDNFVMVSKTDGFTIYFSMSSTEPECSGGITITLDNPVLDLANYEISVFPNPASEIVNVIVKTTEDLKDVERKVVIVNLLGQVAAEKTIVRGQTLVDLNVEGFAAGVYLLQILVDDQPLTVEKLVVK